MGACFALFLLHLSCNFGSKNAIMVARILELSFRSVETNTGHTHDIVRVYICVDLQSCFVKILHLLCHATELALQDVSIFLRLEGAILTYVRP